MKHLPIRTKHFSPFGGNAEGREGLKKTLLLLTFAFYLSTFAFSQQYGWTDISANMSEQVGFNDIHVIGDEIWITGGNAEVFYSPDGGETFQIQTLPANSGITSSIFMKNNQEGYVVTYSGKILKTENGGTNWTMLHEPGGGFNSVHFPPNSDTGYACGSNGKVWMFDDTSITDISPSGVHTNLQSICFPEDNTEGKVCGQTTIARYKNNTWANLQFYDGTLNYNSIFFINNILGWSCGINGTILRTNDGSSWVFQESNTTIENFNDIFFINSLEGWAVGTEVLSHSVDSGSTWTEELANQTIGVELRAIYFTSANNGYVVGNDIVLKYGELTRTGNTIVKTPQLSVFPNPATSELKVQSSKFKVESATVAVFSIAGKKLLSKYIPAGCSEVEVDISSLNSGIYFCKIQFEDACITEKIVVKK